MILGEVSAAAVPRVSASVDDEIETHMQYRLDLVGGGCTPFTAVSDEDARKKAFAILDLHPEASRELFVAKRGRRIWHVGEERQAYPPMQH